MVTPGVSRSATTHTEDDVKLYLQTAYNNHQETPSMVSITIENVSKAFGDTQALDDINLEIEPGEIFFLLGPSGCGKTTLIRTLAGFTQPDTGRILFNQTDMTAVPPHKRQTAMMFQSYALWPHLNVAKNVAFGLEQMKIPKAKIAERVEAMLALVQLQGLEERSINALSGGQQQRVALARALAVRPQCLLLDEPLSNLDAKLRLEMRGEIRQLCKVHGLTAIYVTHDQKEALSVADRVAILEAGKVAQVGRPQEIYRRPRTCAVAKFIGESNFIGGRVKSIDGRTARLDTAHGRFLGTIAHPNWTPAKGELVVLAIRPESLALTDAPRGPNTMDGFIASTTYLGEIAQHELKTSDGSMIRTAELNPRHLGDGEEKAWLHATVQAEDVIVLQAPLGVVNSTP